ncbi:MAG: hypothetical protein VB050_01465 [Geobacteraceae bacterium]|nr:hypothetical protein [Geobacteraceae bacterium]
MFNGSKFFVDSFAPKINKLIAQAARRQAVFHPVFPRPIEPWQRHYTKTTDELGNTVEIKMWQIPISPDKPHGFKYSLVYIIRSERAKKQEGVYFTDYEAFRKALTPKRLELLRIIKEQKPISIHQLAKRWQPCMLLVRGCMAATCTQTSLWKEKNLCEIMKTRQLRTVGGNPRQKKPPTPSQGQAAHFTCVASI